MTASSSQQSAGSQKMKDISFVLLAARRKLLADLRSPGRDGVYIDLVESKQAKNDQGKSHQDG